MPSQIKPIAGLERVPLAQVIPLATPFTVFVFPTTFCNFKCVYCGHSLGHQKMKETYGFIPQNMTMDTYRRAIEQLKAFGQKVKVLSLTGHGEPLLHPQIAQMVEIAKKAEVAQRIEIISNASLLTHTLADDLLSAGLDCLRISLQGVTKEKYRDICAYDITFEDVVEKLTYFYHHKGDCQLFVKMMDVALDTKEQEALFYSTFQSISDRMFIEKCRPVYHDVAFTDGIEATTDRYGREHPPRKVCPLCFFMLGIFPNGDVEPCDTIYKPVVLGNIHQETLAAMWQGETLREFRKMQLEKRRDENAKCASCCAPDDVSHPEDSLDEYCEEVKKKL